MKMFRLGLGLVMLQLVFGCAMQGSGQASDTASEQANYTARKGLTPQQRFREALLLLEAGKPVHARVELVAYLDKQPGSEVGHDLLKQIDTPAEDYFPGEYREVQLQAGESLSTMARDYLGNVYQFHALSKYNGIEKPRSVRIGETIRIPLTEFAQQAFATGISSGEAPPASENQEAPEMGGDAPPHVETTAGPDDAATRPVSGQSLAGPAEEDDHFPRLDTLYREALNAYRAQNLDKAIDLWGQVLAIDPEYENARLYQSQAIELRDKLTRIN